MGLWARFRLSRQPDGTSPWWGIAILLVGVVLVLLGYLWEGTWEDVFIEVGAAAGVGGIVLLFKPRLMRQVEQTATDAATAATAHLTERFVQLDGIGDAQANELKRLQTEAEGVMSSLNDAVTFSNVYRLLQVAYAQGLFTERIFVKTSEELGQPLLEVSIFSPMPDDDETNGREVFFRIFAPVAMSQRVRLDSVADGTAIWNEDEDPEVIIGAILSAYKRLRLPQDKLELETSFAQLNASYGAMFSAQQEPQDSFKRLTGKLIFLVNEQWALTDVGLEGRLSRHVFGPGRTAWGEWRGIDVADVSCPSGCNPELWEEARHYTEMMELVVTESCRS